jgi:transcriptional regulator with XRE-family HTH domain
MRIRAQRELLGLTQEEAASRAAIDYKRWQRLEQGVVNPTVTTLARVAQAMDTNFWTLLGARPPRNPR